MLVDDMLLAIAKNPLNWHVLPNLTFAIIISTSFDLWMSKDKVDTFALVTNFLNESWTPMHVTVDLFEVNETSGQSMAIQFESLLSKFELMHRVIAFVKYEGKNFTTMALHYALSLIASKAY